MKTANTKQAIYINNLTYILYEVLGSNDTTVIMPISKAMELPYGIADRMIMQLQEKIASTEYELLFKNYKHSSDKIIEVSPIKYIENYKEVDRFRIDKENKVIQIITLDQQEIRIEAYKNLKIENFSSSLDEYAIILKKAIDEEKRINIYSINNTVYMFLVDEDKANSYRIIADIYNKLLKATDNKVICSYKNEKLYERGIRLVEARDIETYKAIKPILQDNNKYQYLKRIIKYADDNLFGLCLDRVEVHLY
jgi:hypothetical protein